MSKKHDESKDLRLLSKVLIVNYNNKTLEANKSTVIGNRRWGRIDYLCHYCGWTFIWNSHVKVKTIFNDEDKPIKRDKKSSKEHKLTNKKKR